MTKFLFWICGAGEFALSRPLIDYVTKKGDSALIFIDEETARRRVIEPEFMRDHEVSTFSLKGQDIEGQLNITLETYDTDVLVLSPSRGWQVNLSRPRVKLVVALENNIQFSGAGDSYKLDKVKPTWLDYYFVNGDKAYFDATMRLFYGDNKLPKEMADKIMVKGWFADKVVKDSRDYVFVYVGGGATQNQGLLNEILDCIPKEQRVITVNDDRLCGNYPNLIRLLHADNFDELLLRAKYCIFHEIGASATKALVNQIPFVSVRGDSKTKFMETEAINICGYAKSIDRRTVTKTARENFKKVLAGEVPDYDLLKPTIKPKELQIGIEGVYTAIKESL